MSSQYNFEELMKKRHSVRKFQSKEIPEDVLKNIISTSLRTPSWANSQPWNIYVVSGQALEEIRKVWISKNNEQIKGYSDIPPVHRIEFDEKAQRNMSHTLSNIGTFINDPTLEKFAKYQHILFNAPTVVYLTLNKGHSKWSMYDLGALGMSIMLSAMDRGVDSIVAYELIKYPDVLRQYAKIPENEDVVIGIALGYEENEICNEYRSDRNSLDEVCHFIN